MSAEIGAYQDDLDREPPRDPGHRARARFSADARALAGAREIEIARHREAK